MTSPDQILMIKTEQIHSQIHEILEKKKWTQKRLAKEMGIGDPEMSAIMNPFGNLDLKTICKIESALGESVITTITSQNFKYVGK